MSSQPFLIREEEISIDDQIAAQSRIETYSQGDFQLKRHLTARHINMVNTNFQIY